MTLKLPEEYLDNMRRVPELEFDAFLAEYDKPAVKALRFNLKKARPETIAMLRDRWKLKPVPWCSSAYYYEESEVLRPGLSPYHDAGVFYIQEPSAMITAEEADIGPDDIVLDLCAAPGGKSTQAAVKAKYLVSNEPVPNRARILSSNIERMGFDNCIVSSAYPDELASAFSGFFDRIIVDAPCSGEGMMRKDETAVREWSLANVAQCAERQRGILDAAAEMLKKGGRLVYSTCTFEYSENEGQIAEFILRHKDFKLIRSETLYPHRIKGEGHFCAVLERCTEPGCNEKTDSRPRRDKLTELKALSRYMQKNKIHVLRTGVEAGELITDKRGNRRYEPSHAEALSGSFGSTSENSINLKDEDDALSYLKGNVLDTDRLKPETYELNSDGGWITVMYDGYPMGLGKLSGHSIKNHYPKGLRHL